MGGFPKLFTAREVSDMNLERPADDQLEWCPNGLLAHHCCYPLCSMYLKDLRTLDDARSTQKQGGKKGQALLRRHGLFKHLAPMMYPEATGDQRYVPMLHTVAATFAS